MVYLASSQTWLEQSALLIEARPTTTRITTKYRIAPARSRRTKKPKEGENGAKSESTTAATDMIMTDSSKPPRARLILKTFDPASGAILKYKTTKAAEVSRLVQMLGSLGHKMAALPDVQMTDEVIKEDLSTAAGTATPPVGASSGGGGQAPAQQQQQQGGGGGGKGKKKKGKR